jgi:anti-sigma regulatory factor (Ser/Thr protein kinase)
VQIAIGSDDDLVPARAEGRALAGRLGFSRTDATLIATAISEIARNIVAHAGTGQLLVRPVDDGHRCGVTVVARDDGPGIRDVAAAMQEGAGHGRGHGLGLAGARRIMDEFGIESRPGRGTTVRMTKWRERGELEQRRARRGTR